MKLARNSLISPKRLWVPISTPGGAPQENTAQEHNMMTNLDGKIKFLIYKDFNL